MFFQRWFYYVKPQIQKVETKFEYEIYLIKRDLLLANHIWKDILKEEANPKKIYDFEDLLKIRNSLPEFLDVNKSKILANLQFKTFSEDYLIKGDKLPFIIEAFVLFKILKKYPYVKTILEKVQKNLSSKFTKSWTEDLITMEKSNNSEINFPSFFFNESKIKAEIKAAETQLIKKYSS